MPCHCSRSGFTTRNCELDSRRVAICIRSHQLGKIDGAKRHPSMGAVVPAGLKANGRRLANSDKELTVIIEHGQMAHPAYCIECQKKLNERSRPGEGNIDESSRHVWTSPEELKE